jgi:hypothetical protein
MKKMILFFVLLLWWPGSVNAEETPIYEAFTRFEFQLREARGSGIYLKNVPGYSRVSVYEYDEDFCKIGYGDEIGWCKTERLWGFRSLDALNYSVPGYTANQGAVQLTKDTWILGGKMNKLPVPAGTVLCVAERTEEAYIFPVWRGEGSIPLTNGEMVGFDIWEEAVPGQLLHGFTTFYNDQLGKQLFEERADNIALGCRRIQGTILEQGEQFSFNALCGPYTQENGYRLAPNISKAGKGYGGGVCQVTTTLYNALLGLPLQIDEWAVHQFAGVDYVPQFFDAAVGTYTDLKFTNTLPYPIRISVLNQEGVLTILIYREGEGI